MPIIGARTGAEFDLQFDPLELQDMAARYNYGGAPLEAAAFEAGKRIAYGEFTRAHLADIVAWKSPRSLRILHENEAEIRDALHLAMITETERAAIATLIALDGVGVPVASAVLTMVDENRYTIVDRRALESLGQPPRPQYAVNFYLDYLDVCRELSRKHGVSLRTLDRALWQWSAEQNQDGEDE